MSERASVLLRGLDSYRAESDPWWMESVHSDWIIQAIDALPEIIALVEAAERVDGQHQTAHLKSPIGDELAILAAKLSGETG